MTTQRRLKYSVSDASRRMYREETNGIYRKLENPWPTENQLRHQQFEARQRPLSHILASSSFRDTLNKGQVSGGQSLSNLKKARLRNSLNLPINFSLDSEYFVNANGDLNSSGTLGNKPKFEQSAFSFVPEKDIISLADLDSSCTEIGGTSDKASSVGSKKSAQKFQTSRKSSTSSSSHTPSNSESTVDQGYEIEDIERGLGIVSKSESDCNKSFKSRTALQKRLSFKEVFPEPVNQEFLEKNYAETVERKSFSPLQQDANHIFDSEINIQDMCTAESVPFSRASLNRSLSSESGGSCSPKNATQVFDSSDHFQPMGDSIFTGNVEIPEALDLEPLYKEGRYTDILHVSRTRSGPLKTMNSLPVHSSSQYNIEIETDIDPQTYKDMESQIKLDRSFSVESVPPPLPLSKIPDVIENISLNNYVGNECDSLTSLTGPADSPKSVKCDIKIDSGSFVRTDENPNFPGTAITYYGPIYASNNTLILPQQSNQSSWENSGKEGIPCNND